MQHKCMPQKCALAIFELLALITFHQLIIEDFWLIILRFFMVPALVKFVTKSQHSNFI